MAWTRCCRKEGNRTDRKGRQTLDIQEKHNHGTGVEGTDGRLRHRHHMGHQAATQVSKAAVDTQLDDAWDSLSNAFHVR
eukprot:2886117-Amphidinium_carterae.1